MSETTTAPPRYGGSEDDLDATDPRRTTGRTASRNRGQRWIRWIHVYTSMISLVLVLFFGLTGLTLNHPNWTFGDGTTTTTKTGTLGFDPAPKGSVDYLAVSEYLRATYGVGAEVSDYNATAQQGTISYRAPGYAADATFSLASRQYTLTVQQQGFVAVMNDLHKGRDADTSWKWLIDVIAGFLVVISLSGLALQLYLRRRRRSALLFALGGAVIASTLAILTL